MPITSVYATGSVSVSAQGTEVTGAGTSWIGAGIREGDMFWAAGLFVKVLELVDDTHLTLAHPWPGPQLISVPYEVHYTPDAQRVLSTAIGVLETLDSTALGAIKHLSPEADTFTYFNSSATAAKTAISALGRSLLDDITEEEMRATLGLVLQGSNPLSATENRVLTTGSFGLGSATPPSVANIDSLSIPTSIVSVITGSAIGTLPPLVGSRDAVLNISIGDNAALQVYFSTHSGSPVYYRIASPSWSPWGRFVIE